MLRLSIGLVLFVSLFSVALSLPAVSSGLASQQAVQDPTDILDQEAKEGFSPLFDGKTLDGWIGRYKGIKAKDGMILVEKGCRGAILTEKEYGDFVLRFEFRLHPGTNNGLILRSPKDKLPPNDGLELQILDDSAKRYAKLKEYQFHGSLYFVAPAERGFLKKVGEWNTQEVSCIGSKLKVTLNDHVILDIDLSKFDPEKTIGHQKVPALRYTQGHLGFLCHNDPIELRNLRIKEVKTEKVPVETAPAEVVPVEKTPAEKDSTDEPEKKEKK